MDWAWVAVLALLVIGLIGAIRRTAAVRRQLREFGGDGVTVVLERGSDDGTPEVLTTTIHAGAPSRLIITRRRDDRLTRLVSSPPPLIEHAPAAAEGLQVHADEPALADALFADEEVVRLLRENLIEPRDQLELSETEIKVIRAVRDTDVRPVATAARALATRVIDIVLPLV